MKRRRLGQAVRSRRASVSDRRPRPAVAPQSCSLRILWYNFYVKKTSAGQYFPRIRCGKAVRTFRRKIGTSFLFFFCFWFFGGAEGDLLFFETAAFGLVMVLIEL